LASLFLAVLMTSTSNTKRICRTGCWWRYVNLFRLKQIGV